MHHGISSPCHRSGWESPRPRHKAFGTLEPQWLQNKAAAHSTPPGGFPRAQNSPQPSKKMQNAEALAFGKLLKLRFVAPTWMSSLPRWVEFIMSQAVPFSVTLIWQWRIPICYNFCDIPSSYGRCEFRTNINGGFPKYMGTPNPRNLNSFSIETYGILGIPHFGKPPDMYQ